MNQSYIYDADWMPFGMFASGLAPAIVVTPGIYVNSLGKVAWT